MSCSKRVATCSSQPFLYAIKRKNTNLEKNNFEIWQYTFFAIHLSLDFYQLTKIIIKYSFPQNIKHLLYIKLNSQV